MNVRKRPDRVLLRICLVLCSTLLVALQDAVIKEISGTTTLWQIYVLRSVLLIPALLLLGLYWGDGKATLVRALTFWPIVRSTLFMCMYFSMHFVIQSVPLSIIAAGIYTAPLFVALITSLTGLENPRPLKLFAVAVGFAGVLLILRPGADSFDWRAVVPVFGGLFYALVGIVTRTKCHNIPPVTLAVSLSSAFLVIGLVASTFVVISAPLAQSASGACFLLGDWPELGSFQWLAIFGLFVLMFGNGLVLPAAYQMAPTTIVATFDYCYLIFATLLGLLFFGEVPGALAIAGMLLIILAGLMIARCRD